MKALRVIVIFFIAISFFVLPTSVKAFSLKDISSSSLNFLSRVQEKIEYTFAFSNTQKVKVLSKQAAKRLADAQSQIKSGNESLITQLMQDYRSIRGKQSDLLKNSDVPESLVNNVKDSTLNDQKAVKTIVDNVSSDTAKKVVDSDRGAVSDIKQVVVVKGGESKDFENSVSVVWAEGTGPATVASDNGKGEKNNVTVVGGLPVYAPGTSGGGEGGVKVEGGNPGYAPGTSGGGEGGGGTKVEGGNPGYAPGTSGGGEGGGVKVEGDNPGSAAGSPEGGESGQTVVEEVKE